MNQLAAEYGRLDAKHGFDFAPRPHGHEAAYIAAYDAEAKCHRHQSPAPAEQISNERDHQRFMRINSQTRFPR